MADTMNSEMWGFSITHDFPDEQRSFCNKLHDITSQRDDIYRFLLWDAESLQYCEFVSKGVIWFETPMGPESVKAILLSNTRVVTDWHKEVMNYTNEFGFPSQVIWKSVGIPERQQTPIEPAGFKFPDSVNCGDVCLNCGI